MPNGLTDYDIQTIIETSSSVADAIVQAYNLGVKRSTSSRVGRVEYAGMSEDERIEYRKKIRREWYHANAERINEERRSNRNDDIRERERERKRKYRQAKKESTNNE